MLLPSPNVKLDGLVIPPNLIRKIGGKIVELKVRCGKIINTEKCQSNSSILNVFCLPRG